MLADCEAVPTYNDGREAYLLEANVKIEFWNEGWESKSGDEAEFCQVCCRTYVLAWVCMFVHTIAKEYPGIHACARVTLERFTSGDTGEVMSKQRTPALITRIPTQLRRACFFLIFLSGGLSA